MEGKVKMPLIFHFIGLGMGGGAHCRGLLLEYISVLTTRFRTILMGSYFTLLAKIYAITHWPCLLFIFSFPLHQHHLFSVTGAAITIA